MGSIENAEIKAASDKEAELKTKLAKAETYADTLEAKEPECDPETLAKETKLEKALKDVKDKERDAAHESIALASKVSSMKASADDEAAALMASERQSAQDDKELARRK